VTRPAREISWEDVCTDLPAVLTGLAGR
jgi:hypothetical protein